MFADAVEKAMKFTRPVIISTRQVDGTVTSTAATFFVINDDGWILTAGHIFDSLVKYQSDINKIKEVDARNAELPAAKKNTGMALELPQGLKKDPGWLTNHSFWFGWDGVRLVDTYVNRQADIAVGRLEGFKPQMITDYPVFRDPKTLRPGTSVCRLGFPFANLKTDFDQQHNAFRILPGTLPMPFFPNEGMHARNMTKGKSSEGGYEMLYIETSTPGLPGQSGGPIFDTRGMIYAMQVQTENIPLGFHPSASFDGKTTIENQFLNVGLGIHGKTIQDVLRYRHIRFDTEAKGEGDSGDQFIIN